MDFAVGAAWFVSSALLSTFSNSAFLAVFHDAAGLTAIRFLGSAFLGGIVQQAAGCSGSGSGRGWDVWQFVFPGIFLVLANWFNSVSLSLCGITLTYVTKCGIPVVTAVYVVCFQGKRFSLAVYLSLIVTCLGVALSCWADMEFNPLGFLAAVLSTFSQVAMNISSKSAFEKCKNVSGIQGQFIMVSIASLVIVPALALQDYFSNNPTHWWENYATCFSINEAKKTIGIFVELFAHPDSNLVEWIRGSKLALIMLTAIAYHLEYVLNFLFVTRVSRLSFSLADISRRLAIVISGAILFNKTLTTLNLIGIAIALGGVTFYTILTNINISDSNNTSASKKEN